MGHDCPICASTSERSVADTPYHECPTCFLWFQSPMPAKLYQAPTEYDLQEMPEHDRKVNRELAASLFEKVIKPGRADDDPTPHVLDIGAKHPVLSAALAELGCHADAIDGVAPTPMDGVKTWAADFETMPIKAERDKYDLITMIHVFEHMYDPVRALSRLRLLVEDDGRVFLRIPDHRVSGFKRDLTPHHFTIHPYFHCLTSILEALATVGDCFVIERAYDFPGHGQRDIVLKPIKKRQTLAVAMIAKNEERDIGRAIDSFKFIAHDFVLVDTGSTDETRTAALKAWQPMNEGALYWRTYTDASERDEAGDWKLWDFSAARNQALQDAEDTGADWVFWMDADDELTTQNAVRRAMYWHEYDLFECWITQGGPKWIHHRLWRADKHVRFAGRVHEYPVIDGLRTCNIAESLIRHHGAPADGQENSNPRNLRILLREWEEKPTPRCCFYIGDTYNHGDDKTLAAEWYAKRIAMTDGYAHERAFAMLYRARALRALERYDDADAQSRAGMLDHPDWQEFPMEIAFSLYHRGQHQAALNLCVTLPTSAPIPSTPLWREPEMYRDQPPRLISWCYEHMGDYAQAVMWSRTAAALIGSHDEDWSVRHRRLEAQLAAKDAPAPAIVKRLRRQIALHRPGAIGDILMTLNLVPALRAANPDADIHYFCSASLGAPDALGGIMLAAGVDVIMDCATLPAWRPQYDRVIDLIGYPLAEGYPERRMRLHLLEYFAAEMGVTLGPTVYPSAENADKKTNGRAALPALTLRRPPVPKGWEAKDHGGNYYTIQIAAGWSAYKEWPRQKWDAVMDALLDRDITFALIDPGTKLSLADSIAVFANARMHLGIDSFTNHLSNYFWTDEHGGRRVPGVILWGSTQYTASGYDHNTNISKGLECQPCFRENPAVSRMPRGVCVNPPKDPLFMTVARKYGDGLHQCMQDISVDEVVAAALALWEETK